MNYISPTLLKRANEEAIYNIYLYLAHKTTPIEYESLKSIVFELESEMPQDASERDIYRLEILKNAVAGSTELATSRLSDLIISKSGLSACVFTRADGNVSVVFKGTGSGEWIDSGEGLSGIPEENTYLTYISDADTPSRKIVRNDYATDQQVEALNWFSRVAFKNGWDNSVNITVSGHSKGGNKAQFIAAHSDLIDCCCSFDAHGFSPEALSALKNLYGAALEMRRQHIYSFSADNDYVNILGERLVLESNIFYFKSKSGLHYIDAILDKSGKIRPQCEQGMLSSYIEAVSKELMDLKPSLRQYATLGVMNIFQKYLGEGIPVNDDKVSIEKTVSGLAIAIASMLNQLRKIR